MLCTQTAAARAVTGPSKQPAVPKRRRRPASPVIVPAAWTRKPVPRSTIGVSTAWPTGSPRLGSVAYGSTFTAEAGKSHRRGIHHRAIETQSSFIAFSSIVSGAGVIRTLRKRRQPAWFRLSEQLVASLGGDQFDSVPEIFESHSRYQSSIPPPPRVFR